MNDGSPLEPEDVSGLGGALMAPNYAGPQGFNSLLEGNPHGTVHVAVGGDMSSVPTAARDPVFWLHHGNVDRLWDVWRAQGSGQVNPSDPSWLNQAFPFADESGSTVQVRVKDYTSSAQLGYRYDTTPPSPSPMSFGSPSSVLAAAEAPPPKIVAASVGVDEPLARIASKPLGFAVERVRVKPSTPAARAVMAAPAMQASARGRVYVRVEGLSATAAPSGIRYGVYLNPPQEVLGGNQRLHYHIGTVNFFGKTQRELRMPGHGHSGHAGSDGGTFDETFDATMAVFRLHQEGRWNPDALDVVIMPIATIPAGRTLEGTRSHAQNAARAADVKYKRVVILQD